MNKLLGNRIKKLREEKNITQEQVSKGIGFPLQKYINLEQGLINVTYFDIISISNIIGVDVSDVTSVLNESDSINTTLGYLKNQENDSDLNFIIDMLNVFYAHRNLHYSVKNIENQTKI